MHWIMSTDTANVLYTALFATELYGCCVHLLLWRRMSKRARDLVIGLCHLALALTSATLLVGVGSLTLISLYEVRASGRVFFLAYVALRVLKIFLDVRPASAASLAQPRSGQSKRGQADALPTKARMVGVTIEGPISTAGPGVNQEQA